MDNLIRIAIILFALFLLYNAFCSKKYEHMEDNKLPDHLTVSKKKNPLNREILGIKPNTPPYILPGTIQDIIPNIFVEDGKIFQNLTSKCELPGTKDDKTRTLHNVLNNKDIITDGGSSNGKDMLVDYITRYTLEAFNTNGATRLIHILATVFNTLDSNKYTLSIKPDGNKLPLVLYEINTDEKTETTTEIDISDKQRLFFNKFIESIYNIISDSFVKYLLTITPNDANTFKNLYDLSVIKTIMDYIFTLQGNIDLSTVNTEIPLEQALSDVILNNNEKKYIVNAFNCIKHAEELRYLLQNNRIKLCKPQINEKFAQYCDDNNSNSSNDSNSSDDSEITSLILHSNGFELKGFELKGFELKDNYSDNH